MKVFSGGLIEQHIHGAFGYDFMTCSVEEMLTAAEMLIECGVIAFFPTIMTDDINVIEERVLTIKEAQAKQKGGAKIIGIHLEGPFINPEKSGIHDKKHILPLDINLYKKIEDNVIKIVTLAPELDNENRFINYLKSKKVKISAGHCTSSFLENVEQVTHLYNAMGTFSHRGNSTCVSALANDNVYTEIIGDSMHVSDDVLKLTFRAKSMKKILLISDALPLAHSDKSEHIFAGQKIYNKNGKLVNEDGVFAGSSYLLCDIVKNLVKKELLSFEQAIQMASKNQMNYHQIENNMIVHWDDNYNIIGVEFV